MNPSGSYFEVVVFDGNGIPYDWAAQQLIMVLDMDFMPAFQHRPMIITSGYGCVRLPCADGPFAICMPLDVPGFGHVYVYADNEGSGYASEDIAGTRLHLNLECALSRLAVVRRALDSVDKTAAYREVANRLDAGEHLLGKAQACGSDPSRQAEYAMQSLAETLHAGELLAVERARQAIEKDPDRGRRRNDFRFGCNGFGYGKQPDEYAERFADLFNYVTAPFYRSGTEPEEGKRDFSAPDRIAGWAAKHGIRVKGHPLIWLHEAGTPAWLRHQDRDSVFASHLDYVSDAVGRFAGRIDYWDIINEAHSWNNIHRWPYDDLLEITGRAAQAARSANPEAFRVVNCCFTWSEYVATGWGWNNTLQERGRSTLEYCRDLIASGIEFDAIGLQVYDPGRDLFEISRHIDLFCSLDKPVHITELGISSSSKPIITPEHVYVPNRMFWHGRPWSEREQADWIEGFYTICYAKPGVEAVTWWDFADPAFLPHGGMLDESLRPKEGYRRLKGMIDQWRR